MNRIQEKMKMRKPTCAAIVLCVGLAGLAGCAGGGASNTVIPTSSQVNTYAGTQYYFGVYGGVYSLTIDHSTNYFNLSDQNYMANTYVDFIGNITDAGQFEKWHTAVSNDPENLNATLYAVEVPGDAALIETDSDLAPVISSESENCASFATPETFQFIEVGDTEDYGAITVNTGKANWSFSNFDMLQTDGTDDKPPALGNGVCQPTVEGNVTTISTTSDGNPILNTVAISPNGYFIMNRGSANLGSNAAAYEAPLAGVVQPSSPLNTTALIAANYAGVEYDSGAHNPQVPQGAVGPLTQPVVFSGANAANGEMMGGIFPSQDPTQTPGANIGINLGAQDPNHNGLFPSVTVSVPDARLTCAGTSYAGKDASGNPTCLMHGAAVAGNPGGKYVLFVTAKVHIVSSDYSSTVEFLLYPH